MTAVSPPWLADPAPPGPDAPSGNTTTSTDDHGIVLIVGCPRSGTYLLQQVMSQAFSIAFPVETHYVPAFLRTLALWGDLSRTANRRRLLEAIYEFIEIFTHQVLWSPPGSAGAGRDDRFTLLATRPDSERIVAESAGLQDMLGAVYGTYTGLHGADRRGEKCTFFVPVPIADLAAAISDPMVIHIVRDGRDVCLSWMETWHGPKSVDRAARLWRRHVAEKRLWGRDNPGRYLEVCYEDLLEDLDAVLDRIARFIAAERSATPVDLSKSEMARQLASVSTHSALAGGLLRDRARKWQRRMDARALRHFETVAGSTLESFGYACAFPPHLRRPDAAFWLAATASWIRERLSRHHWRLKLRDLLPIVIWLARRVGLSPARFLART